MELTDIIGIAGFCFLMVFVLLGGLYLLVRLSTSVIRFIGTKIGK